MSNRKTWRNDVWNLLDNSRPETELWYPCAMRALTLFSTICIAIAVLACGPVKKPEEPAPIRRKCAHQCIRQIANQLVPLEGEEMRQLEDALKATFDDAIPCFHEGSTTQISLIATFDTKGEMKQMQLDSPSQAQASHRCLETLKRREGVMGPKNETLTCTRYCN